MQVIAIEPKNPVVDQSQSIMLRVQRILEGLSSDVNVIKWDAKTARFVVAVKEKKGCEVKLWSEWQISVQQSLSLQVFLTDPHQSFLLPDPSIVAADLLQKMNRQSIFGTYFTNQGYPPLINFRYSLALDFTHKFLTAALTETYLQTSQQFARWVLRLKLASGDQKCKSTKMHHCLKRMRYMKEHFEAERLNRAKSLKVYDLTYSHIKVVEDAMRVISYHTALLKNHKNSELKKNNTVIQNYKNQYQHLLKQMSPKDHQNSLNYIMRGIDVSTTLDQKKIDEGGFSCIFVGEYIAAVGQTINSKIQVEIKNFLPPPLEPINKDIFCENASRKVLVKKTLKNEVSEDISFKNEINLLKFIRSQKHERIGEYYYMNSQPDKLFMQYYPTNLLAIYSNWSERQLFCTTRQILRGVNFLSARKVLHRDLKELNILVDLQNHPRIIDFGSSCGIYQQKPVPGDYQAISNLLMSTQNYYFPYRYIVSEYPNITKHFNKEQYERAPTFDLFAIGTIIRNLFALDRPLDSILHRQLSYLADKCRERNPEDRLTAKEADCYMYLLSELHRIENEESKKVSLRSVKDGKEVALSNQLFQH